MSEPREEYYALEKCAAGRDIRGTDFITVKIDVQLKRGDEVAAIFNHPWCFGCSGGTTYRRGIRTLDSFLGDRCNEIVKRLKGGEHVHIRKRGCDVAVWDNDRRCWN